MTYQIWHRRRRCEVDDASEDATPGVLVPAIIARMAMMGVIVGVDVNGPQHMGTRVCQRRLSGHA